jgi:hypothetical protein
MRGEKDEVEKRGEVRKTYHGGAETRRRAKEDRVIWKNQNHTAETRRRGEKRSGDLENQNHTAETRRRGENKDRVIAGERVIW